MTIYHIDNLKDIRSRIIMKHLDETDKYSGAVIISCGNAYESLKTIAGNKRMILGLSTSQEYDDSIRMENRFYSKEEIKSTFPNLFNATSGALNSNLMWTIGWEIYRKLGIQDYHDEPLLVPVGSGETLLSLSHVITKEKLRGYTCDAYPHITMDYTYLAEELKQFEIIKINSLGDINKLVTNEESALITW